MFYWDGGYGKIRVITRDRVINEGTEEMLLEGFGDGDDLMTSPSKYSLNELPFLL